MKILGEREARRFFPAVLTPAKTITQIDKLRGTPHLAGVVGLGVIPSSTRAALDGHTAQSRSTGRSTEALGPGARALPDTGFGRLGLEEIVLRLPRQHSQPARLKELGMIRTPADDFEHPRLAEDHTLPPHVLYLIRPGKPYSAA